MAHRTRRSRPGSAPASPALLRIARRGRWWRRVTRRESCAPRNSPAAGAVLMAAAADSRSGSPCGQIQAPCRPWRTCIANRQRHNAFAPNRPTRCLRLLQPRCQTAGPFQRRYPRRARHRWPRPPGRQPRCLAPRSSRWHPPARLRDCRLARKQSHGSRSHPHGTGRRSCPFLAWQPHSAQWAPKHSLRQPQAAAQKAPF